MNRLTAGFVLVPNPFNPRQIQRISLLPQDVDAIFLWTKSPGPILPFLDSVAARFPVFLHQTITAYPRDLEPCSPDWEEAVGLFRLVAERLGPSHVIWRYDPFLFTGQLDESRHLAAIERTAAALAGHTDRLVISFVRLYRKTTRNLARLMPVDDQERPLTRPHNMTRREFVRRVVEVAGEHGMEVRMCAVEEDFGAVGAPPGACVDADLLNRHGIRVAAVKDTGQRGACRCAPSKDIGMYDSCPHGCLYCYANQNPALASRNLALRHDPEGPSLLELRGPPGFSLANK